MIATMVQRVEIMKKIRLPKKPPMHGIKPETTEIISKPNIGLTNSSLASMTLVVSKLKNTIIV
ncbi:hypothetical protein [Clostridium estertheticum]|uniref:hypothetical protein n=2 Tax=Clostridium estertheticum TaxID=238834 RepID=UPI001C7D1FEF|nr:hypothetical protein [Clostridium estertheticum]MBX4263218.1 hypothetical protein [Clostridium estertheticum]WLC78496.1 hypothetical protein KTC98_14895 [Clostridium estertheticum]WLC89521.1 hypothetical protein KTC95_04715 [Clostridium estertheticum]